MKKEPFKVLFGKIANLYLKKENQKADKKRIKQEVSDEIDRELPSLLREMGASGCIMLKNENDTLPLKKDDRVAVFGRCAFDYFYVGYGSGGDVKRPYNVNLIEGLKNANVNLSENLLNEYEYWIAKHPHPEGGWGAWPYNYPEYNISLEKVYAARMESDVAIIVIGRSAGEDRETMLEEGSFYLTKEERELIKNVTSIYERNVVIINSGSVIDFSWVNEYRISALLLPYMGGMEAGNALADCLTGKVSPSGKLNDTIPFEYADYPSAPYFGQKDFTNHVEDIYVGYRYFETFCPEKVQFPFGFGLSYTSFEFETLKAEINDFVLTIDAKVTNVGEYKAKDVLQVYMSAPQGELGKPSKELIDYIKTKELDVNETQELHFEIDLKKHSHFADKGTNKGAYLLEKGLYSFYLGESVRDNDLILDYELLNDEIIERVDVIMPLYEDRLFNRMVNNNGVVEYEQTPLNELDINKRIHDNLKEEFGDHIYKGHKLQDVVNDKITLKEFVGELPLDDLINLSFGEGPMDSIYGVSGNTGIYGGVSKSLREKGVPPVVTSDGPAGLRLKVHASLLPIGATIAASFDRELLYKIGEAFGREAKARNVDVILGPGMNLHRDTLCGRNFEYFSEDPYLSGSLSYTLVKGIESNEGISACPKHFALNNQETNRFWVDERVSERALREIYLRNFEYSIRYAKPKTIMSSYNEINDYHSYYNYDLLTTVLRKEWGYEGLVISDWVCRYEDCYYNKLIKGDAWRVRSGCNVNMPGSKDYVNKTHSTTIEESLKNGSDFTIAELEYNAMKVLENVMKLNCINREIVELN